MVFVCTTRQWTIMWCLLIWLNKILHKSNILLMTLTTRMVDQLLHYCSQVLTNWLYEQVYITAHAQVTSVSANISSLLYRPSSYDDDDADTNLHHTAALSLASSTACCMLCFATSSLIHVLGCRLDPDFFRLLHDSVTLSSVIALLPFLSHTRTR